MTKSVICKFVYLQSLQDRESKLFVVIVTGHADKRMTFYRYNISDDRK